MQPKDKSKCRFFEKKGKTRFDGGTKNTDIK